MTLLAQLLINGVANGAVYALMAVGFAIIFSTTHIFHLAHGAVLTFAAYCFYMFLIVAGLGLFLAIPATMVAAAAFGCLIELSIYSPIRARGGGPAAQMIASLGALVLCQNAFAIIFSTDVLSVHSENVSFYRLGSVTVTPIHLADCIVAIVVFLLLHLFLKLTPYGRAIRALADNSELAPVVGIQARWTYFLVMAIGSILASVSAMLLTWDIGVQPQLGFLIVFFSAVAVAIGGHGYLLGALIGAFVFGILQQLAIWQLNSRWEDGVTFALVMVILAIWPKGIFGARVDVRKA